MKNFIELQKAINEYIENVTERQLDEDFRKAEWEVYSKIDVKLFDEQAKVSWAAPYVYEGA